MAKITHFEEYTSIGDFIDKVKSTPEDKIKDSRNNSKEWAGCEDVDEALEYAEYGYEMDYVTSELADIQSNERFELTPVFDVSGGEVDMGMYMTGEPECMIEFDMKQVANKYVHLIIGITEAAGVSAQRILNRAAAISSIVDNLENRQYRVRLSLSISNDAGFFTKASQNARTGQMALVDIKDYGDHLPIANLSGVLHSGFYRRAIFQYWEGHKYWACDPGYGRVPSYKNSISALKKFHEKVDVEHAVYLPSMSEGVGGSSKMKESFFQKEEEAGEYADWVTNHIDNLTIKNIED